jgi:hypothetical protein
MLLLAGVCGVYRVAETNAQAPAAKKAPAKKTRPLPPLRMPPPLRMTITSKDSDVHEMARLINKHIEAGWAANKVVPSGYADDYDFIRRASLDIIGRIAKVEEIAQYMRDPADRRRSLLIERLLKHEDYARHWANLWANWLLTRSGPFGRGTYKDQMTVWLEDQFAQNKPYSEIVTRLLTAKGKNTDNGSVNFILAHVGEAVPAGKRQEEGHFEMVPLTSRLTRLFLGTQVQCCQCHPHPFHTTLKQEAFWGVNAFLRQVKREGNPVMRRRMATPAPLTLVDDESVNPDANVFFEMRNGKVRMWKAEFLPPPGKERGVRLDPKYKGIARREELAKFVVEHDNFSRAMVNRMWGIFFGRGIVNPVDDFNDNNQPSHPELLEELGKRFKHYNYDLKKLIRWITHSNAYHLSYVANRSNDSVEKETAFGRMILKSMTPEQLFESLMVATRAEAAENAAGKKRLREQWLGQLITNFGDDEGNEVTFNGTIVQALMMMNGKDINDAISRKGKGGVALALARARTGAGIINELYLAALNRRATPAEVAAIMGRMRLRYPWSARDGGTAPFEDLFWALLNSNEFILNH